MKLVELLGTSEKERKEATAIFKNNNIEEILSFLDTKGNIHFPGVHGETALHWAAFYGNEKLVVELYNRKADLNLADRENKRTPIVWATKQRMKSDENKGKEYRKVIHFLLEKGADPDLTDHTRRNAFDHYDKSPRLFSHKKIKDKNDDFLKKVQYSVDKPKSTLEEDGDDSSDEEITEKYSDPSELFDRACDFEVSDTLANIAVEINVAEIDISLAFSVHANGLSYLYGKEVNNFYYKHDTGKKSLGNNKLSFESLKIARSWIATSLKETTIKVIYHSQPLTQDQENYINKMIYGEEDKMGIADDCMEHIRLIMRQNFSKAKQRLNSLLGSLDIPEKQLKEIRQSDPKLKRRQQSTIVNMSPETIVPLYIKSISPKKEKNNEKCLNFCLLHLVNRLCGNNPHDFENDQKEIIDIFDLYFIVTLDNLRGQFDISFIRGRNAPYIVEPFQYGYAAVGLFSSIRLANRVTARTGRELAQNINSYSARTADNSFINEGQTRLGHYIHQFTQWHLVKGHCIQMKDELTTNLVRSQYIGHTNGSYKSLNELINHYRKKLKISDSDIAKWLREIINGQMSQEIVLIKTDKTKLPYDTSQHREFIKFLSELAVLLFVCEPMRNPAAFVCHQMILDLIELGDMSWKEALASKGKNDEDGGAMPMSMVDAVSCSRYLHEMFAAYLPYPYKYAGEACNNPDRIVELIERTSALVQRWYKITHKQRAKADMENLMGNLKLNDQPTQKQIQLNIENIYSLIMENTNTWYPSLTKG